MIGLALQSILELLDLSLELTNAVALQARCGRHTLEVVAMAALASAWLRGRGHVAFDLETMALFARAIAFPHGVAKGPSQGDVWLHLGAAQRLRVYDNLICVWAAGNTWTDVAVGVAVSARSAVVNVGAVT